MPTQHLEDVATLARSALLDGLAAQDIGALLGHLEIVTAPPGHVAAREGAAGDGLCFVLEGKARAESLRSAPEEIGPGAHFGVLTLTEEGRHGRTVTALTELRLARLGRAAFDALGREHQEAALHLATAILRSAAREIARARERRDAGPEPRRRCRPAVVRRERGAASEVATGTRVADLVPEEIDGSMVVGAMLDQLAVPLHAPIVADATVAPLTARTWQGRDIYRRTAGLVLLEAAHRAGCPALRMGPSITSGRFVHVGEEADLSSLARRLDAAMAELIGEDVAVREEVWKVDEAADHFLEVGWDDAAALLAFWHEPTVLLVSCGSVLAFEPGPMLPTTGMLKGLSVRPTEGGLILDYGPVIRRDLPARPQSTVALEIRAPRYGAEMTRRKREWLELLGVTSVGAFSRACVSGQVRQLIHVSEGFHEKRIAGIADEVSARKGVRIIGVAGPSSSGKTTFIKRLKVQLEVNGIHPFELSLDDYYVDRERSPRDADGEYDFEALEALDRPLLNDHVRRLLAGERVRTARYDFLTGRSAPEGGRELQLDPDSVLLVEGIHALNPALLETASNERAFRVFIHPASALPYDRLSLFEPADVRLVRRLVRDRHHRGTAAADNLARWPSVRRGERLHIFPFQGEADAIFDSSLVYELSVLRVYAERYLLEVPRSHPEYSAAHRLRWLLRPFVPIHPDHVPPTSILREFIGGSGFSY